VPYDAAEIDDHVSHRLKTVCGILFERLVDEHSQRKRHGLGQRICPAVHDRVQNVQV
jgi:hypothetical protein